MQLNLHFVHPPRRTASLEIYIRLRVRVIDFLVSLSASLGRVLDPQLME